MLREDVRTDRWDSTPSFRNSLFTDLSHHPPQRERQGYTYQVGSSRLADFSRLRLNSMDVYIIPEWGRPCGLTIPHPPHLHSDPPRPVSANPCSQIDRRFASSPLNSAPCPACTCGVGIWGRCPTDRGGYSHTLLTFTATFLGSFNSRSPTRGPTLHPSFRNSLFTN